MNEQIKAFVNLKFVAMVLQIFLYQSCIIMLEPRGPAFAKCLFGYVGYYNSIIVLFYLSNP